MTTTELRTRVTVESGVATATFALLALALWGPPAAWGIVAASALALGNFWWLARGARAAAGHGPRVHVVLWTLGAGARFLVLLAAFAALFASGVVHPVAVVAGLTVLPCALVARGLCAARPSAEP